MKRVYLSEVFGAIYIDILEIMKKGFITLLGLLFATLILGFWFVKTYSGSGTEKSKIDTYNQSIDKAEDAKKMLEKNNVKYSEEQK